MFVNMPESCCKFTIDDLRERAEQRYGHLERWAVREIERLQEDMSALKATLAGVKSMHADAMEETERLRERESSLVEEAVRQVFELNERTEVILKRQCEIQRLKKQSSKFEDEIERLRAENADLLFAFRVQIAAVTPKTDDEIAAVARVFEKARGE